MKNIFTHSNIIFGGFILFILQFITTAAGIIQYMISTGIPGAFSAEVFVVILMWGLSAILLLINLIYENKKRISMISFSVVVIYMLSGIIPDMIYYNFSKTSSASYFFLFYCIFAIILLLKETAQNVKEEV